MKPSIDSTTFGSITIEGTHFEHDVIIQLGGEVKKRKKKLSKAIYGTSHIVSLDEAKHVYETGADRLIIGTGQYGNVRLSDEAKDYFARKQCQVDLLATPEAVLTWNNTNGSVIGLFHVTCSRETRMPTIKLYGTNWCSDCKRSKKFLGEQRVPYDYINIEEDTEGQAFVQKLQNGGMTIPTIAFDDGSVLIEPTNAELATKLGLNTQAQCEFYDLITVGGGPTALTTAIYAAREGFDVLVIERSGLGGQAGITERLDNYPGFPEGVTGAEFAERIIEQAKRYGVELLSAQNVMKVGNDEDAHFVETESGHKYRSNAILIAPGSTYKRLGVPGEDEFIGAGVHFCATCDGPFYKGREVAVIGGGNSAVEEAAFLTRFSPKVTILVRGSQLTASKLASDKALNSPQIEVRFNTEVIEFRGEKNHLTTIVTKNTQTGEVQELNVPGVFVFIGLSPNSRKFQDIAKLDAQGFILTGIDFQTSTEGIFAAGDVRSGSTKQLVSAAGEGAAAALAIREHLRGHDARSMESALVGRSM